MARNILPRALMPDSACARAGSSSSSREDDSYNAAPAGDWAAEHGPSPSSRENDGMTVSKPNGGVFSPRKNSNTETRGRDALYIYRCGLGTQSLSVHLSSSTGLPPHHFVLTGSQLLDGGHGESPYHCSLPSSSPQSIASFAYLLPPRLPPLQAPVRQDQGHRK